MLKWREELVEDIHDEFGAKPIIATLATVDGKSADARNVVVRQIHADGALQIVSDARSRKNSQLKANPSGVAVIWLPKKRKQYRLAGTVQVIGGDNDELALRTAAWYELSNSARALFHWPACGEPIDAAAEFPPAISADAPVPANFELLLLAADWLETLDLNPHPHQRVRWIRTERIWNSQSINP